MKQPQQRNSTISSATASGKQKQHNYLTAARQRRYYPLAESAASLERCLIQLENSGQQKSSMDEQPAGDGGEGEPSFPARIQAQMSR